MVLKQAKTCYTLNFVVATHTIKEVCWLCTFIGEAFKPLEELMIVCCDNQSAITISKNNKYQGCTKHIDIHYKWVYEIVTLKLVDIIYCPMNNINLYPVLVSLILQLEGEC